MDLTKKMYMIFCFPNLVIHNGKHLSFCEKSKDNGYVEKKKLSSTLDPQRIAPQVPDPLLSKIFIDMPRVHGNPIITWSKRSEILLQSRLFFIRQKNIRLVFSLKLIFEKFEMLALA